VVGVVDWWWVKTREHNRHNQYAAWTSHKATNE
jgi:hypothetical protein